MSSARPITRDDLMPGAGSSSYKRDDRARPRIDDLALDAEILQHAFERLGVLLDLLGRRREAVARARRGQERERRQRIAAAAEAADRRGFLRLALRARGCGLVVFVLVFVVLFVCVVPLDDRAAACLMPGSTRSRACARRGGLRCASATRRVMKRQSRARRLRNVCTSQPSEIDVRSSSCSNSSASRWIVSASDTARSEAETERAGDQNQRAMPVTPARPMRFQPDIGPKT